MLRQVEMIVGQGKPVDEGVQAIGTTEAIYYRWHAEYGGLKLDQVECLKVLEQENGRLQRAMADLMLESLVLKEAVRKPLGASRCRAAVTHIAAKLDVSEQFACRVLDSASFDAAQNDGDGRRRGSADSGDLRLDQAVWPLRLPAGHGVATIHPSEMFVHAWVSSDARDVMMA